MNIGIVSYSYPFVFKDGKKAIATVIDVVKGKNRFSRVNVIFSPAWFKEHPLFHGDEVSMWYDRDKDKYTGARKLVID